MDQYDVVHAMSWEQAWAAERAEPVNVVVIGCGTRLVTCDTRDPVNCFNCLTGARDWKYG